MSLFDNSVISDSEHVSVLFLGARFFIFFFVPNNDYTDCIKPRKKDCSFKYKKSPLLLQYLSAHGGFRMIRTPRPLPQAAGLNEPLAVPITGSPTKAFGDRQGKRGSKSLVDKGL